ncbi:MAG: NUDIX domain-containing protein [Bacteroidaceae bacterium]|nr:NUDIX domain-containing protein [Bacteroidaceae bacterium]
MKATLFNETLAKALAESPTQEEVAKSTENPQTFNIMKTDDDKRLIFGWASVAITKSGEQVVDHQNDIIDPEDLEEAVYKYVLEFRDGGEEHIAHLRKKARMVESCMFTKEKMNAMGIPEGIVPEGWWIGFYVDDDEAWEKVKNGTYRMFSVEGKGVREAVDEDEFGKSDRINGCGVLVLKDGKLLTATRIDGKHKNQICGPGGHIDRGEEPEEAAIREAYEEFGIECKNLKPLGILDGGRYYGKSAVFLCTEYDGEPKTDEEEMTDCKWRTIEELREEKLFWPFEQSLDLIDEEGNLAKTSQNLAKSFDEVLEILKFNPFHDSLGRFASSDSFVYYSANPKTKAGAMAISRSAQAGHGKTFNSHKESQGENITQNYAWLNGGPGAKQLAAQGQLASQQPKQPPKPQKNYDKLGYADHDDADFHQLYNGKQYFAQQKLTAVQTQAAANYLESHPEPGSLYSHCQNMNYKMATGQALTGKYKATHDGMMSAMHNIGYNITLTRYDHDTMVNGLLKTLGAGNNYENMSISSLKKALVGVTLNENKFLSTSYNDFKNAPQSTKQVFDTRAVKINYKVKADAQGMMPGKGPGGDFGEIVLAPTNGKANRGGKITDVRLTGQMVRRKGTQIYNQQRIEIDIEI